MRRNYFLKFITKLNFVKSFTDNKKGEHARQ